MRKQPSQETIVKMANAVAQVMLLMLAAWSFYSHCPVEEALQLVRLVATFGVE